MSVDSARIDQAVARLADLLPEFTSATSLMLPDYLHRGWKRDSLAGARELAMLTGPRNEDDALLWRLVDPSVADPAPPPGAFPSTELLAIARGCDRARLPADFSEKVETALGQGGYGATHAAMAIQWAVELNCSFAEQGHSFRDRAAKRVAAERSRASTVGDLELEQTAVLMYLGRRDLVSPRWISDALEAELPLGGWSEAPGGSEAGWHATCLGTWVLLAWTADPVAGMLRT